MNKQILIIEDDEDIADQIIQQRLNQANVSNHMQVLGALLDREVRIDVGTDDMQVLISVIDSGPGVPEPHLHLPCSPVTQYKIYGVSVDVVHMFGTSYIGLLNLHGALV